MTERQDFSGRTALLLGAETMALMAQQRVIIFGVGGVGSWCAESLVRTGIGHLTIVDPDRVCTSNINRQLMATTMTVGLPKAQVLRQRLLDINPQADITTVERRFCEDTLGEFPTLANYDYVIDAIDSLKDKALLIRTATATTARLFSSMGAALKMDAARISVTEFWKVKGDPLARALRKRFKRDGLYPGRKFLCVYSDEQLTNKGTYATETEDSLIQKAHTNGTVAHITAIFGFTLAGLVVQDIANKR